MNRLTISKGKLRFYEPVYTKCSNDEAPEIKRQKRKGIRYCDMKGYKYEEPKQEKISKIYSKLSHLEDIMEKYGIESVEELENKIISYEQNKDINLGLSKDIEKLQHDRDTWKKACELACEELAFYKDWSTAEIETMNFYTQAQKDRKDEN